MTKRSFLEWIEQKPGGKMAPNELIKEFEKKFGQLPRQKRQLLEPWKCHGHTLKASRRFF